jgi:hypothetical protein
MPALTPQQERALEEKTARIGRDVFAVEEGTGHVWYSYFPEDARVPLGTEGWVRVHDLAEIMLLNSAAVAAVEWAKRHPRPRRAETPE